MFIARRIQKCYSMRNLAFSFVLVGSTRYVCGPYWNVEFPAVKFKAYATEPGIFRFLLPVN